MARSIKVKKSKRLFGGIIAASLVLMTAIIIAALDLTHVINLFGNSPTPNNQPAKNGISLSSNSAINSPTSNSKSNATTLGGQLLVPSGDFVSSHVFKLSDSSNQVSSVCVTSPESFCEITFSKDNQVISLGSKTTSQDGYVYWQWNVNDLGLTPGSWQIQAKATLSSQTKTADDAMALEISP